MTVIAGVERKIHFFANRLGDRLRGHQETIDERLVRDVTSFHDLPPVPYEACEERTGWVSSLSLVRYRGTDYSVPTAYGHREVLIRGYVDEVVISCGTEMIARHPRSYERGGFRLQPAALPGIAGTEDRGSGPGGSPGRLEAA